LQPLSPGAFQLTEKTYKEGVISIKYPQITGYSDAAVQSKLNQLIADSAMRDLPALKKEAALAAYEITDVVALNNPAVLSVYFNGYSNYQGAVHPNQFFYSMTIDVKKLQTVTLSQLVTVTPDFVAKLQNADIMPNGIDLTPGFVSAVKDSKNELGTDFWVQQLKKADTSGAGVSSFLTKDALGISIGVPHVMGDHAEFLLKFSDLHGFQTDNILWKSIEK
jgi:alpha-L-arabinofuranosidase